MGEYQGNFTGNHTKRSSSTNAATIGSPSKPEDKLNIAFFERRYDQMRALTLADLAPIMPNFRSGIPKSHKKAINTIITDKRVPLNPAFLGTGGELEEWTLDITSTE